MVFSLQQSCVYQKTITHQQLQISFTSKKGDGNLLSFANGTYSTAWARLFEITSANPRHGGQDRTSNDVQQGFRDETPPCPSPYLFMDQSP